MKSVIVGIAGCSKCKMLKDSSPNAEYVEMKPDDIIVLARALDIKSMPFVVHVGNTDELEKILN